MKMSVKIVIAISTYFFFTSAGFAQPLWARACSSAESNSPLVFRCATIAAAADQASFPPIAEGARFFPSSIDVLGFDQRHNSFFPVTSDAPSYLKDGVFWAAPLTGIDFLRLVSGYKYYPQDGGQTWGSVAAQWLGNVMGVSVAEGLVFVQLGDNTISALDAQTGRRLWQTELVNSPMGHTLIQRIDGRLVAFVTTGDIGFTLQNADKFARGERATRGANFSSTYALDALTGEKLWRFDMEGTGMPTAAYRKGMVFVTTGDGYLYTLNAASGTLVSQFATPGRGINSMASPNWFDTADGRTLIIYGTGRPANLLAIDVTQPAAPKLAWKYAPARAVSLGDIPVAIDPVRGLVVTNVLTNLGTALKPVYDINVMAFDATTGAVKWNRSAGGGPIDPVTLRTSVPMIHGNAVYFGNLLNQTYQSYDLDSGAMRWSTSLVKATDQNGEIHQPRGAAVYYQGKIIQAEGRNIRTFDAATGTILNNFQTPGVFGLWSVTQPAIVGNVMFLGSLSGWVFAAPVSFITTSSGSDWQPYPSTSQLKLPLKRPEYFNAAALPKPRQAAQFSSTCAAYAGGPTHNAFTPNGPRAVNWQTALNNALPLDAPPRDEAIFGTELATLKTALAFGAGAAPCPASGILYMGSNRYTINAFNALTGKLIWRYRTMNANFAQPLVTPSAVIVGGGDPWFNLAQTQKKAAGMTDARLGASFQHLTALDRRTGREKWTLYTPGTNAMTPLYYNGGLYWVNGEGKVWAVDAETGAPIAPFMDANGFPTLTLTGFNATASANIYRTANADLMLIGTANPGKFYGIDLKTAAIRWSQSLPQFKLHSTGFAATSPVVDQASGLVLGAVLVDPDPTTNTASLASFALNAATGEVHWTQVLDTGVIPPDFTVPTAMLYGDKLYVGSPMSNSIVSQQASSGRIVWQSVIDSPAISPGVVIPPSRKGAKPILIQAAGPHLFSLDADTGQLFNQRLMGGSFVYNHPTIAGRTIYIGNSWGWVQALPLDSLLPIDTCANARCGSGRTLPPFAHRQRLRSPSAVLSRP